MSKNDFNIDALMSTGTCSDDKQVLYEKKNYNVKSSHSSACPNKDINSGDFFLEKDLQVKQPNMHLHFYRAAPVSGGFIPKSMAHTTPISSQKFLDVLKRFSIHPNSVTANVLKESIENCETPNSINEKRICATSLESMVDFATSVLETKNLLPLSTRVVNRNGTLNQR